ncbi:MAG: UTRA domain-containing protein [Collinsella sp.]
MRRLNCIDGEPVSIEMTLIPCLLFPGIEDVDISVFSLFGTYDMLGRKPDQSVEKLDIEALGARDASLLNLEPGDLALVLEGLTYDSSGQAIEHAKSFTRGDAGGYTYNY